MNVTCFPIQCTSSYCIAICILLNKILIKLTLFKITNRNEHFVTKMNLYDNSKKSFLDVKQRLLKSNKNTTCTIV